MDMVCHIEEIFVNKYIYQQLKWGLSIPVTGLDMWWQWLHFNGFLTIYICIFLIMYCFTYSSNHYGTGIVTY